MIAPHRISYGGYSSEDFNLLCDVAFDSDSGDMSSYLTREAVASESYHGDFKRVHIYKYTETFSPMLTFMKNDFSNFTLDEQRRVLKWLTSKRTASFLTVYHDRTDDDISYEILGAFTEINTYKLANGRVVGITATFESVAPYAFSPLQKIKDRDVSNPSENKNTIELEIKTDEPEGLVYPRITIKHKNDTAVVKIATEPIKQNMIPNTIYNCIQTQNYYWLEAVIDEETGKQKIDTEGNPLYEMKQNSKKPSGDILSYTSVAIQHLINDQVQTEIKIANNKPGGTIIVDGANRIISDETDAISRNRVFGDHFSWNWIGLREGTNTLSFIGNCIVTIEYREPIKCGDI